MGCKSCGGGSKIINRESQKESKVGQTLMTSEGTFKVVKNKDGKIQAIKIPQ